MFGHLQSNPPFFGKAVRGFLGWFLVILVFCILCVFTSGFDTLSFHFSLALSPILSVAVGSVNISCLSFAKLDKERFSVGLRKSLIFSALLTLFPLLFMLAKGVITYHCDVSRGLVFYLAGPFFSALFAFSLSAFLSSLNKGVRIAFIAIFCFSFLYNLLEIYFTPAIFFYNPFLGFYPGAIYDVAIEITPAYCFFRLFCLFLSLSFLLFAYQRFNSFPKGMRVIYAGSLSLIFALALFVMGSRLGFRGSTSIILSELDRVTANQYCIVRYDPAIQDIFARLVLEECSYHHRMSASFFGVQASPPVEVFLYKDDDQKARLTGARDLEVSKPWLNQVHISHVLPHEKILAHEIAHVVGGRLLSNPLRIPLRYGFIPDMALVEGMAVAYAFYDDGPSPHEEAVAYLRGTRASEIEKVAQPLGFVLEKPEKAYLLMGSLLRFIRDRYGLEAFRSIIREGRIGGTGHGDRYPFQEWVRFLEAEGALTVTREMEKWAAAMLSGPGVLGIKCHVDIAYLLRKAQESFSAPDLETAKKLVERARRMDPDNEAALFEALRICAWSGDKSSCPAKKIDAKDISVHQSLKRQIALADAKAIQSLLEQGYSTQEVFDMLHNVLVVAHHKSLRRSVLVRLEVLDMPVEIALLAYKAITGFGSDQVFFLEKAVADMPDSKILHYLLARGLCGEGDYVGCLSHSQIAFLLGIGEDFYLESLTLSFKSAFYVKDWTLARKLGAILLEKAHFKGQREWVKEMLARMNAFE